MRIIVPKEKILYWIRMTMIIKIILTLDNSIIFDILLKDIYMILPNYIQYNESLVLLIWINLIASFVCQRI